MEEQNIAIRLKGFIDSLGLSYSQFADTCGIPRPSLSQLINGRNKKISDVLIGQIHSAYPRLSVVWLLFGEGPMLNINNQISNSSDVDSRHEIDEKVKNASSPISDSSQFASENSIIPNTSSDVNNQPNVRALSVPANSTQVIEQKLIEAEKKIMELRMQIDNLKKFPRKVSQITIYYDDSTFETFLPMSEKI